MWIPMARQEKEQRLGSGYGCGVLGEIFNTWALLSLNTSRSCIVGGLGRERGMNGQSEFPEKKKVSIVMPQQMIALQDGNAAVERE